jgi:hypothetical protein
MATYDYTWKVTDFDSDIHICTVVYKPKDKKLNEVTTTMKIINIDELEDIIKACAPVHDWHRQNNEFDANTIIGLTGKSSTVI